MGIEQHAPEAEDDSGRALVLKEAADWAFTMAQLADTEPGGGYQEGMTILNEEERRGLFEKFRTLGYTADDLKSAVSKEGAKRFISNHLRKSRENLAHEAIDKAFTSEPIDELDTTS